MGNLTVKESGEMVNFISPNVSKITSFKVHFSPKQEGTGDPSPDNVREITGWNGVEEYSCGKNLVPWIKTNFTVQGNYYNGFAGWSKLWEIPKRISYTYSVFIDNSNCNTAGGARVWLRDIDNSKYTHVVTGTTIKAGEKGISTVTLDFSNLPNDYYACWGLDLHPNAIASMPIVYESDQETAIISDWSSNIGTVYGGYVDLVSGELVQTIKRVEFTWGDCEDSTILGNTERRYIMFNDNRFKTIDSLKTKISNIFSTFLDNSSWNVDKVSCSFGNKTIICKLPVGSDNNTIIQVAGDLKTPIHYQLTPQQLSTLKGQNNFWSNADYVEIEYELTETFDIQKAKRKIILNQPHVESTSGDLVTFDTDIRGKLKECKVYFSPVQEGEGDPSPDNVREIKGWNGVEGYSCGKNLTHIVGYSTKGINEPYADRNLTNNYGTTINTTEPINEIIVTQSTWDDSKDKNHYTNGYFCIIDDNLIFGQRYKCSFKITNITNNPLNSSLSDIRVISPKGNSNNAYIDGDYIYSTFRYLPHPSILNRHDIEIRNCGMSFTMSDFMVTAVDNEDFEYEPYQGTTTSVDWTDSAESIYRGHLDLINGVLTATWVKIHLTSSYIDGFKATNTAPYRAYTKQIPGAKRYDYPNFTNNIICDKIAPMAVGTKDLWYPYEYIGYINDSGRFVFGLSSEQSTKDLAKQWIDAIGGLDLCYELAEPVTYQLTSQQLTTLRGINNIWSSANGQTEIKYWKH